MVVVTNLMYDNWKEFDDSYVCDRVGLDVGGLIVMTTFNKFISRLLRTPWAYLIFVIFFTQAKFLDNKIYTQKRQFFALNL